PVAREGAAPGEARGSCPPRDARACRDRARRPRRHALRPVLAAPAPAGGRGGVGGGGGGRARSGRAGAGARELLASMREGDAVALVLAGTPARVSLAATTDLGAARDAIDAPAVTDR